MKGETIMKFEPTAKNLALRKYQEIYTSNYRLYCQKSLNAWKDGHESGAYAICKAIGVTEEEISRIREVARKIVDYENEKQLQA
jgi:hypothetical protein